MKKNDTIEIVRRFIGERGLLERGDRVLVALSAGPDSTALAWILSGLGSLTLAAAHLNHGLRGPESDLDEVLARETARRIGIPVFVRREAAASEVRRGESIEEAARRIRYRFFKSVCREQGYRVVATGHTGDDQAETVLFRILQGTGTGGLSGMSPSSDLAVHPLLCLTRRQVLEFLEARGLPFRIDSSNYRLDIPRNRIRHQVLPLLEQINPGTSDHLLNLSRIAREENGFLDSLSKEALDAMLVESTPDRIVLEYESFSRLEPPLRKRAVCRALDRLNRSTCAGPPPGENGRPLYGSVEQEGFPGLGYAALERIAAGARQGNAVLYGNSRVTVRKEYGRLFIEKRVVSAPVPRYLCRVREAPCALRIEEAGLAVTCSVTGPDAVLSGDRVHLDYSKASPPLVIRNRRPGDRIRLRGTKPEKANPRGPQQTAITRKIKDLFIDHQVPLSVRDRVPLVVVGDEVAAVFCSLYGRDNRVSERFRVTCETSRVLVLEVGAAADL